MLMVMTKVFWWVPLQEAARPPQCLGSTAYHRHIITPTHPLHTFFIFIFYIHSFSIRCPFIFITSHPPRTHQLYTFLYLIFSLTHTYSHLKCGICWEFSTTKLIPKTCSFWDHFTLHGGSEGHGGSDRQGGVRRPGYQECWWKFPRTFARIKMKKR